jgi:hypothetical protein
LAIRAVPHRKTRSELQDLAFAPSNVDRVETTLAITMFVRKRCTQTIRLNAFK